MRYDNALNNQLPAPGHVAGLTMPDSRKHERYLRLSEEAEEVPALLPDEDSDPFSAARRRGRFGRSVDEAVKSLLPKA